jgi:hypothetical protein
LRRVFRDIVQLSLDEPDDYEHFYDLLDYEDDISGIKDFTKMIWDTDFGYHMTMYCFMNSMKSVQVKSRYTKFSGCQLMAPEAGII